MMDLEQETEKASGLILIGYMTCLFDVLVLFFLPTAVRQGYHLTFLAIMGTLLAVGFILIASGYSIRRRSVKG